MSKKNKIQIIKTMEIGDIELMIEKITNFISMSSDEHSIQLKIFSNGEIKIEGEITIEDSWYI